MILGGAIRPKIFRVPVEEREKGEGGVWSGVGLVRRCSRQCEIIVLVVGFVGFRCPGVVFTPCRRVVQRALCIHVLADIVRTVFCQCVGVSHLCVYLIRVFADGVRYKVVPVAPPSLVGGRAVCVMGLRQWVFAFPWTGTRCDLGQL